MSESSSSKAKGKPQKPYPGFPLFPHATGRWAKKIRGKLHYFGPWADPNAALLRYQQQRDDLHAGRVPRCPGDGLSIRDLVNRFLTTKQLLLRSGEISSRTFYDYFSTCERVIESLGLSRLVEDLASDDFEKLRAALAQRRGPVSLGNEIQRVRMIFKYAFDQGLVDRPMRYGQSFQKPSRRTLRISRAAKGPRMLEAKQIRDLVEIARPAMRAMILLGVNCGFGQTDVSSLPFKALDLGSGWADFPRPKTGIGRRCPLWPETVDAIRAANQVRPAPKCDLDADIVFITVRGHRWVKVLRAEALAPHGPREKGGTPSDSVGKEFGKLLVSLGLKRAGLSFYALRHTFETIGGDSRDQVAVDQIMGHAPPDTDMGSRYRERVSDERLLAVTAHVRSWLYGETQAAE